MDNIQVHNDGSSARPHNSNVGQPMSGGQNKKRKRFMIKRVIMSILVVIVVSIVVLFGLMMYRSNINSTINSSEYQAVFFTNGQVYFGKLKVVNDKYMKLTDVFYIQTPADSTSNPQASDAASTANLQLIKLGNEVHGPEDAMVINRDQVLFFENIKNDGKVTDSITKYYNQNK